ncbi:unnamed protein product [Owenia fusiformis]|uniref:Uncharacterized protein n=1 Tax=Owenia fusiformis TaxID=6347 RepID=A0A8S4N967_OWEFU|nr:unnamed protein product [Owenia fusiformis]
MEEDCTKYKIRRDFNVYFTRNAKLDYYRFPSIMVNNLKDLFQIDKTSPWEIIDELEIFIGKENCSHLLLMVNFVIGVRLFTYCVKNQQHDAIHICTATRHLSGAHLQDVLMDTTASSRDVITIPFTNLLQHFFLRYMSCSLSVPARLKDAANKSPSSFKQLMQGCPMYCGCKYCILLAKLLTNFQADDVIDKVDVVLKSIEESWHHKIEPADRARDIVFGIIQKWYLEIEDYHSILKLLQDELQSNQHLTSSEKANLLYYTAECQTKLEEYPTALTSIEEAIKMSPASDLFAHMMLKAEILHKLQDYTQLEKCCKRSMELQSQCVPKLNVTKDTLEIYYYYTDALIQNKEFEAALGYLEKAKSLCKQGEEIHWTFKQFLQRMITCFIALGKQDNAEYIRKLLEQHKNK